MANFLGPDFLLKLTVRLPALLLALTIHEWAHAYTALRKNDTTALDAGRVSFNPIVHLHPIGTIGLLLGFIGWGRPVPVNPRNLRNPIKDMLWISFAGPGSNLLMALLLGTVLRAWNLTAPPLVIIQDGARFSYILHIWEMTDSIYINKIIWFGYAFLTMAVIYNIFLAFFNLIPLHPLDGASVLRGFLPRDQIMGYERMQQYGPFVLFGLIFLDFQAGTGILFGVIQFFATPISWLVSGETIMHHLMALHVLFSTFQ